MSHVGPFVLVAPLGQGATSVVWGAEHRETGHPVALKIMREANRSTMRLMDHEARILSKLTHPSVPRLLDIGRLEGVTLDDIQPGSPYMVLEKVDGQSLVTHRGKVDWATFYRAMHSVLAALAHIHAHGIVHRDVKLGNVLDRGDGTFVLIDFGIAHPFHELGHSGTANIAGTLQYLAPEALGGVAPIGPWTDLYALGSAAFALLTGQKVFKGDSDEVIYGHLYTAPPPLQMPAKAFPQGLEGWVHRLLAKDPAQRFTGAFAATKALDGIDRTFRPEEAGVAALNEVMEEPPLKDVGARTCSIRSVGLMGRRPTQQTLQQCLANGEGVQVVVIASPPGYGRSSLLRWYGVASVEQGLAIPLSLVVDTIVGRVVDIDSAHSPHRRNVGIADQAITGDALSARIRQLAGNRPALLRIDDIVDGGLFPVINGLAAQQNPPRTLIAVTIDTQNADEIVTSNLRKLVNQTDGAWIDLPLMDQHQGEQVLQRILPLAPDLAAKVNEHAKGCPGLLVGQIRLWCASGMLRSSKTGFTVLPEAEIPEDYEALALRRLQVFFERLIPAEKHCIEIGAAFGPRVDLMAWRAHLAEQHPDIDGGLVLSKMERAGLAIREPLAWRFASATLYRVIRAGMPDLEETRRQWTQFLARRHIPHEVWEQG